jgi:TonB family protein
MSSTSALPLPPPWRLSPVPPAVLRRNFLLCAVFSVLVHAGVAWFGNTHDQARAVIAAVRPPAVQAIVMPPLEPDPLDAAAEPVDHAPLAADPVPMLAEMAPITKSVFIQAPEPTMPPVDATTHQITIPPNPGYPVRSEPIYSIAMLDKQPVPLVQGSPEYPFELRQGGVSGEAVVDFIVDSQGSVRNARVESATVSAFGSSAVAAVSKWHFRAGIKGGKAVNTHMQVPVLFNIDDRK